MSPSVRKPVIPATAWVIAVILSLAVFACVSFIIFAKHPGGRPVRFLAPMALAALVAGYTLLVGYINGDARRRGMRHVLWTWLAILIPNGIGIILYFVLRDPILSYCTACGSVTQRGFAYCPRCGATVAPTCPKCRQMLQAGWTHCVHCGARV